MLAELDRTLFAVSGELPDSDAGTVWLDSVCIVSSELPGSVTDIVRQDSVCS